MVTERVEKFIYLGSAVTVEGAAFQDVHAPPPRRAIGSS